MAAPSFPVRSPGRSLPGLRIGLLSTYPPRVCRLAAFAAALESALTDLDSRVSVVRVESAEGPITPAPAGVMTLTNGQLRSVQNAATWLSRNDVAIVQHDFGIYGGADGDEVLSVLEQITVPSMVILHSVPAAPAVPVVPTGATEPALSAGATAHQRSVLIAVTDRVDEVVVFSRAAQSRLVNEYGVAARRITVIPQGATGSPDPLGRSTADTAISALSTWGFLGPGAGIGEVLDALAQVANYDDGQALLRMIASSGVVIVPYESDDQVTSSVLVEAIAAGRPIISAPFPDAVELLSSGAGILVAGGDVVAMADAIRSILTDADRGAVMSAEARQLAPSLLWPSVAARYIDEARSLLRAPQPVAI